MNKLLLLLPVAIPIAIAVAIAVPISVFISIPVAVPVSTPSCYGQLLCFLRRGLDIMDIIMASQIIIVAINIYLSSPAEECRAETCNGGREHGGNCLGVNTLSSPCCERVGKASKIMFLWPSLLTTSLETDFFCKKDQSYRKNKNWKLSVHVQLNSTCTDNSQLMN